MSSKISKMKCHHCGGQHKQSKCGQFVRDNTMAQLLVHNSAYCYNIAAIPKQILRMSVNKLEMGTIWHGEVVKPENDWRSKPLSNFTKKQLIDRYCKLVKSIDKQVDKIEKEALKSKNKKKIFVLYVLITYLVKKSVHLFVVIHSVRIALLET